MSRRPRFSLALALLLALVPLGATRADEGAGNPDQDVTSARNPKADATAADPDADASAEEPDADATAEDPDADATAGNPTADATAEDPGAITVTGTPSEEEDVVAPSKLDLPPPPTCTAPDGNAEWKSCLQDAQRQIDRAQSDLDAATALYTRAMTSQQPRGAARAKIVEDREIATAHLAQAKERMPELVARARAAGVPVEILAPYGD